MFQQFQHADFWLLCLFNGSDSVFLDKVVVTLTSGFSWIPLFLTLLFLVVRYNLTRAAARTTIGAALLCLLLTDGLADGLVKPLVCRLRPLNNPDYVHLLDVVPGITDSHFSFFSAHAANTFGLAVYFSLLFRQRLATVVLIIWSVVNCWTRLYLAMHYPSDIVIGLIWGLVVGCFVFYFLKRFPVVTDTSQSSVAICRPTVGYPPSAARYLLIAFLLTVIYAVIYAVIT